MTIVKDKEKTVAEAEVVHLIAVYGSLRQGLGNHGMIKYEELLGTFRTEPKYSMYSIGSSFPGLKKDGTTSIVMEVYEVGDETMDRVNMLEGYVEGGAKENNHYNSEDIDTPFGKAKLFIYNNSIDSLHLVENGDWTDYKETNALVNGATC